MANQSIMLKASGLNTNFQSLMEVPPGALLQAKNVVINRDGIIESRRGLQIYAPIRSSAYSPIYDPSASYVVGDSVIFGSSSYCCIVANIGVAPSDPLYWTNDTSIKAKQLFEYKKNVIVHGSHPNGGDYLFALDNTFGTSVYSPVGVNGFPTVDPLVSDPINSRVIAFSSDARMRSEEAKGNFYFTTNTGVKKISAKDVESFEDRFNIEDSGVPKASPPDASLSYPSAGFLTRPTVTAPQQANKVAYRVLWTYTDNNSNLLFGAPSARVVVSNSNTSVDFSVMLNIPIPKEIYNSSDLNYYTKFKYRIYRSEILQTAVAEPSDELYQVYEGTLPSNTGTGAPYLGYIKYLDTVSETARLGGVPLYTNPNSGEGILKSNELPPSCRDIATFKGHMFYANTKTKDSFTLTLSDLSRLNTSSDLIITDGTPEGTDNYKFISQTRGINTLTVVTGALATYSGKWFTLNTANNAASYAFWFDITGSTTTPPVAIPTSSIPIRVNIFNAAPTVTTIRDAIVTTINTASTSQVIEFSAAASSTNIAIITNTGFGSANAGTYSSTELTIAYSTSATTKGIYTLTVNSAAPLDYTGSYLTINSANFNLAYVFWFDATGASPAPSSTSLFSSPYVLSRVNLAGLTTTNAIAAALNTAINTFSAEFSSVSPANVLTVTFVNAGATATPNYVGISSNITRATVQQGFSDYTTTATAFSTRLTVNSAAWTNVQNHIIRLHNGDCNIRLALWFDVSASQTGTAPPIPSGFIPIKVNAYGSGSPTGNTLATAIFNAIQSSGYTTSFNAITPGTTSTVTVNHFSPGALTLQDQVPFSSFIRTTVGANSGAISATSFPGIVNRMLIGSTIEDTARSMVRAINSKEDSKYYAYYLSNFGETQGKIFIQKRIFDNIQFIVCSKNSNTTRAFDPILGLAVPNSLITSGTSKTTVVTDRGVWSQNTANTLDDVFIFGVNYTPLTTSKICGLQKVVASGTFDEWRYQNVFEISNVTDNITPPTTYFNAGYTVFLNFYKNNCLFKSSSETIGNRLYFSKYQEHEAVPLLNYIDIGSRDQLILRIIQLRESLFILKEDGVYRLAGDPGANPTWDVGAFDTTAIIKSPDTAITLGNQCYFLSNQGVMQLNESSIQSISRPIDNKILPLITTNSNLPSLSFSVSYESDKSFLMWTVSTAKDTKTTICYRYNYVTSAWTEWNLSKTCGIVSVHDDKMYLGPTTDNYIEVERKDFSRFDYADRELTGYSLTAGALGDSTISNNTLFTTTKVGDVCSQTQYISFEEFNRLLSSLDYSYQTNSKNYLEVVQLNKGDDLFNNIILLMTKLELDEGLSFASYSVLFPASDPTFLANYTVNPLSALQSKYNEIIYVLRRVFDNLDYAISSLIPAAYNNSTSYVVGDLVSYSNDTYYKCGVATTGNLPPSSPPIAYDFSTVYAIGDVVSYDNIYYRCIAPNAGILPTNASYWQVNYWQPYVPLVIQELKTLNTGFTTLTGYVPKYKLSSGSRKYEAMITGLNNVSKLVEFSSTPSFMIGPFTVLQGIPVELEYAPQHVGDPASSKQFSVGTLMFEKKSFSKAEIAYNNDISDNYEEVSVDLNSYSTFGAGSWGEGTWGGSGDQSQLRTYIPLRKQRCRFLGCKFIHSGAMEFFRLYGLSLSYRVYAIADRDFK